MLHRRLQDSLKQRLLADGVSVGTEHADGRGGYIDLVACRNGDLEFYEIKTEPNARLCIRQALGQLLEYAYRPPAIRPKRLFVAGEPEIDARTQEYLEILGTELSVRVSYVRVTAF